jgi:hypothetical protein
MSSSGIDSSGGDAERERSGERMSSIQFAEHPTRQDEESVHEEEERNERRDEGDVVDLEPLPTKSGGTVEQRNSGDQLEQTDSRQPLLS